MNKIDFIKQLSQSEKRYITIHLKEFKQEPKMFLFYQELLAAKNEKVIKTKFGTNYRFLLNRLFKKTLNHLADYYDVESKFSNINSKIKVIEMLIRRSDFEFANYYIQKELEFCIKNDLYTKYIQVSKLNNELVRLQLGRNASEKTIIEQNRHQEILLKMIDEDIAERNINQVRLLWIEFAMTFDNSIQEKVKSYSFEKNSTKFLRYTQQLFKFYNYLFNYDRIEALSIIQKIESDFFSDAIFVESHRLDYIELKSNIINLLIRLNQHETAEQSLIEFHKLTESSNSISEKNIIETRYYFYKSFLMNQVDNYQKTVEFNINYSEIIENGSRNIFDLMQGVQYTLALIKTKNYKEANKIIQFLKNESRKAKTYTSFTPILLLEGMLLFETSEFNLLESISRGYMRLMPKDSIGFFFSKSLNDLSKNEVKYIVKFIQSMMKQIEDKNMLILDMNERLKFVDWLQSKK